MKESVRYDVGISSFWILQGCSFMSFTLAIIFSPIFVLIPIGLQILAWGVVVLEGTRLDKPHMKKTSANSRCANNGGGK
jgi:predicted Co/Zn/Cd cation transporter (cation efflux family)